MSADEVRTAETDPTDPHSSARTDSSAATGANADTNPARTSSRTSSRATTRATTHCCATSSGPRGAGAFAAKDAAPSASATSDEA